MNEAQELNFDNHDFLNYDNIFLEDVDENDNEIVFDPNSLLSQNEE
jgi:hypothetical protein